MQRRISLIPQPQQLVLADGDLDLSTLDAIAADPELHPLAWLLSDLLNRGTGLRLAVTGPEADGRVLRLRLEGDRPEDLTTAAEAYRLDIAEGGVVLAAAHPAGIARGIATLRQLLPADSLREAPAAAPVVPLVAIDDEPRLRWRGVMIDVVRHFQPKDFVLKMIDRAWLHRMNVVHLHLTDDQGWRFDVPSRPKLAEIASWREETKIGHARDEASGYEPTPHGGIFSVPDLREIASYARERHIMIVPEVNLPGHARAVLAAYPELGAGQDKPVSPTFGVFEEVLEPTQASLDFALEAYTAIGEVFEGPFVHIGGDEVPMTQWESSPSPASSWSARAWRTCAASRPGSRRRSATTSPAWASGSSAGTRSSTAARPPRPWSTCGATRPTSRRPSPRATWSWPRPSRTRTTTTTRATTPPSPCASTA
nr:hypothetical protein GCM10025732_11130 [Glycomyces mayteni]